MPLIYKEAPYMLTKKEEAATGSRFTWGERSRGWVLDGRAIDCGWSEAPLYPVAMKYFVDRKRPLKRPCKCSLVAPKIRKRLKLRSNFCTDGPSCVRGRSIRWLPWPH